jgi:hypothetical protein
MAFLVLWTLAFGFPFGRRIPVLSMRPVGTGCGAFLFSHNITTKEFGLNNMGECDMALCQMSIP